MTLTLAEMAVEVLTTADGRAKTALSHQHANAWFAARAGQTDPIEIGRADPPMHPARPEAPQLVNPREVPLRHADLSHSFTHWGGYSCILH